MDGVMGHLTERSELPCKTRSVVTISTSQTREKAQGGWVACSGTKTKILTLISLVPKSFPLTMGGMGRAPCGGWGHRGEQQGPDGLLLPWMSSGTSGELLACPVLQALLLKNWEY